MKSIQNDDADDDYDDSDNRVVEGTTKRWNDEYESLHGSKVQKLKIYKKREFLWFRCLCLSVCVVCFFFLSYVIFIIFLVSSIFLFEWMNEKTGFFFPFVCFFMSLKMLLEKLIHMIWYAICATTRCCYAFFRAKKKQQQQQLYVMNINKLNECKL